MKLGAHASFALCLLGALACGRGVGQGPVPEATGAGGSDVGEASQAAAPSADARPAGEVDTALAPDRGACRPLDVPLQDYVVRAEGEGGLAGPGAAGLAGVAFGNGRWVAVGRSHRSHFGIRWLVSSDGERFEAREQAVDEPVHAHPRVFFALGRFLLFVTHDNFGAAPPLYLYTSTDGERWSGRLLLANAYRIQAVASDGTRVGLAVGVQGALFSEDLDTWEQERFGPLDARRSVNAIAHGAGRWLVATEPSPGSGDVDTDAVVYSRTDGGPWTRAELPATAPVSLHHAAGTWLAVDRDGQHFTSSDGERFARVTPTGLPTALPPLGGLLHTGTGEGLLRVALDESTAPVRLRTFTSVDGAAWRQLCDVPAPPAAADARRYLYQVAHGRGRHVLVGFYELGSAGNEEAGPILLGGDTEPSQ